MRVATDDGFADRATRFAMKMSGLPTPFASGSTPTIVKPTLR